MKPNDLLDAMGDIEEKNIIDAYQFKKKSGRIYFLRSAVALVTVAACFAVLISIDNRLKNRSTDIVYAQEFDTSVWSNYGGEDKLTYGQDVSKVSSNKNVRVFIVIRDISISYPNEKCKTGILKGYTFDEIDNYTSDVFAKYNNKLGGIPGKECLEALENAESARTVLENQILEKEAKWLKTLGAMDIKKMKYHTIVCTIDKENLSKLNQGKCRYVTVLAPKDISSIEDVGIETWFGDYVSHSVVYFSPLLSMVFPTDFTINFTMNKNEFSINSDIGLNEVNMTEQIEYKEIDINDLFKNNSLYDPMMMDFYSNSEMLAVLNTVRHAYSVSYDENTTYTVLISDYGVYLDLSMGRIVKCEKNEGLN